MGTNPDVNDAYPKLPAMKRFTHVRLRLAGQPHLRRGPRKTSGDDEAR